ncbi:MAG TPA: hypothetical protein VMD98_07580 [Bryocella sp.]|nr:hypothetical protein [Bryocella sp.]
MTFGNLNNGRAAYARFLLLAGVFLYGVFTFTPTAVQMLITLVAWGIVSYDNIFHPKKNKSLASLLCVVTAISVFFCGLRWRITHEDVWSRLALIGASLMAALIFLDRREEWFDLG